MFATNYFSKKAKIVGSSIKNIQKSQIHQFYHIASPMTANFL